jgi:hypothetical protein
MPHTIVGQVEHETGSVHRRRVDRHDDRLASTHAYPSSRLNVRRQVDVIARAFLQSELANPIEKLSHSAVK